MLGYVSFPKINEAPYPLTVAPYSFLWFELQPSPAGSVEESPALEPAVVEASEQIALDALTKGWTGLLSGSGRQVLESTLPGWLSRQRWFGAKTRTIQRLEITEWIEVPAAKAGILSTIDVPAASTLGDVLLVLSLEYAQGGSDRYLLPLTFATGAEAEAMLVSGAGVVLTLNTPTGPAILHDASDRESLRQALLGLIAGQGALPVDDATSAAHHIAATLIAAHEGRPSHEIDSHSAKAEAIASAVTDRHSIEAKDVAPEFAGHMPGAADSGTLQDAGESEGRACRGGPDLDRL